MSEIAEIIRQNLFYIILGYTTGFFMVLLYFATRNRGKILVRSKSALKESEMWMKPNWKDNEIVMTKATDKDSGWTFKFTNKSLLFKTAYFGLKRYFAVEVFPYAKTAIEFDCEQETVTAPHWDKKTEEMLFRAKVIRAAGETGQKLHIPLALYLIIVINVVMSVVILLVSSGKIKLG